MPGAYVPQTRDGGGHCVHRLELGSAVVAMSAAVAGFMRRSNVWHGRLGVGWGVSLVLDVAPAGVSSIPGSAAQWGYGLRSLIYTRMIVKHDYWYPAEPHSKIRARPDLAKYQCPGDCGRTSISNKTNQWIRGKKIVFCPVDLYVEELDEVTCVYMCCRCALRLQHGRLQISALAL